MREGERVADGLVKGNKGRLERERESDRLTDYIRAHEQVLVF